jgi:lipopolysaccharide/colanic/teichoic acid biosynthesis glycosyltransferase
MARSRLLLIALTMWLTLFFNIERLNFFGLGSINLDPVVYVVAAVVATLLLIFPDIGKHPASILILALVFYGVARVVHAPPATQGSVYIVAVEIVLLVVTLAITRTVSLAQANFEQAVENIVLNPSSSRILPMAEGEEKVNNELFRARRFDRPVGFIIIRITSLEGMRPKPGERFDLEATFQRRYLQVRIAQVAETTLYRSDLITWNTDNLVICLPETNRAEALQQAKLIHTLIRIRLNVDVPIGIATFPEDGLIYRDLVDAALLNRVTFDDKNFPAPPGGAPPSAPKVTTTNTTPAPPASEDKKTLAQSVANLAARLGIGGGRLARHKGDPFHDPDFWVHELPYQSASSRMFYKIIKRGIDLVLVIGTLPVTLPLMGLIALLIWLDDHHPVLFVQSRTGLGGKRFKMYKFRSMVPDAEAKLRELAAQGYAKLDAHGKLSEPLKLEQDPRITRIGHFVRRTGLDELPQLYNILKGDMSLVGPRPTSWSLDSYTLLHTERLSVRPGLTGLGQIYSRSNYSFDVWLQWDMLYIDKMSLSLDVQIMLRTIAQTLKPRRGAS